MSQIAICELIKTISHIKLYTWIPSRCSSPCSFLCIGNLRTKLLHLPSHRNQFLLHHLTMFIVFCKSLLLILNGSPNSQEIIKTSININSASQYTLNISTVQTILLNNKIMHCIKFLQHRIQHSVHHRV